MSSNDACSMPRQLFFVVIAATPRDFPGAEWVTDIDAAWRKLLDEIEHPYRSTRARTATALDPITIAALHEDAIADQVALMSRL